MYSTLQYITLHYSTLQSHIKLKVKKSVHYIAQYPLHRTAQCVLHFTLRLIYSIKHHANFSRKISAMQRLLHKLYTYTEIHHCLSRCSFIQPSELDQLGVNKLVKCLSKKRIWTWNLLNDIITPTQRPYPTIMDNKSGTTWCMLIKTSHEFCFHHNVYI